MNERYMKLLNKLLHLKSKQEDMHEIEYRPLQKLGITVARIEWDRILKRENE